VGISLARWESRKRFGQEPKGRDLVAYRAYQQQYQATRRAWYLAEGWCPDCGGERDSLFKRCARCRSLLLARVLRTQFRLRERLR